jgi:hypothetical protein
MTKIITCSELRYLTLAELEALFRTLQIELGRPTVAIWPPGLAEFSSMRRGISPISWIAS